MQPTTTAPAHPRPSSVLAQIYDNMLAQIHARSQSLGDPDTLDDDGERIRLFNALIDRLAKVQKQIEVARKLEADTDTPITAMGEPLGGDAPPADRFRRPHGD